MISSKSSLGGRWLWFAVPLLLLAVLVASLVVPGGTAPPGPGAVEVAESDVAHDPAASSFVIRQHCSSPVMLMNWSLEEKGEQEWKRVKGTTFPGGQLLNRNEGLRLAVTLPAGATACRVRVQYGLGLTGAQLWRKRARLAWRTGRWAAALHYNEWEASESVSSLLQ